MSATTATLPIKSVFSRVPRRSGSTSRYLITDNPDATNGPPVVARGSGSVIGGNNRVMILERVYEAGEQEP